MTEKQIVVVGGGVVGVCTAYFLAEAGHEVVVIERHHNVAQEASFAHGGVIAADAASPWAAPGMPRRFFAQMFKREAPVLVRPRLDRPLWRWARRWMAECELERYRINRARVHRVASYSRALLGALRDTYQIEYEETQGILQLLRSEADRTLLQPALEWLAENEIPHSVLEPDAARAIEPALASGTSFAAAVHLPHDLAGNCPLFAKRLRHVAAAMGVHFYFTSNVESLTSHAGRVALQVDGQEFAADAVVLAAGIENVRLLAGLGLRVPLYPVRGYSITAPIKDFEHAPQHVILDEAYKSSVTRLGNRVRVSGAAELGAPSPKLRETALRTLGKVGADWFPQAANYAAGNVWTGTLGMLPDGVPLLGATPVRNVFINMGHGADGWAMAPGSGKILADLISGRAPDIDMDGLTLSRYG